MESTVLLGRYYQGAPSLPSIFAVVKTLTLASQLLPKFYFMRAGAWQVYQLSLLSFVDRFDTSLDVGT